jgi:hypothetical protein
VNELRALFPTQITRGALLRPDGVAVGLVVGGAPSWDLRSLAGRSQVGEEYHRLLLALQAPIDVYLIDEPPNLAGAIATLVERHECCRQSVLASVLSELIDELAERAQHSSGRAKRAIWAVTVGSEAGAATLSGFGLSALLNHNPSANCLGSAPAHLAVRALAVVGARGLADALAQLGGTPPPRLMEAEEIARLLYVQADPVRAQRYPLAGTLLDRVWRIVTP